MREIKFRAWVDAANRMFGPFGLTEFSDGSVIVEYEDFYGRIFLGESTLMQYTGLKDKNGKEIYEGDIINDEGHVRVIEWADQDHEGWAMGGFLVSPPYSDGVEVIGNIYENLELLEKL